MGQLLQITFDSFQDLFRGKKGIAVGLLRPKQANRTIAVSDAAMLVEQNQRPGKVIEKVGKIHQQNPGIENNNRPEMIKSQDVIAVPMFISLSNLSSQQAFRFCLNISDLYLIRFCQYIVTL